MGKPYKYAETAGHYGPVHCVKLGRKTSALLVSGGADKKVNVWTIVKLKEPAVSLDGHNAAVQSVSFSQKDDDSHVLSGAKDGEVREWDMSKSAALRTIKPSTSACTVVEVHPLSGEIACLGYEDGKVILFDVRNKLQLHTYSGASSSISQLKHNEDGRWVAAGYDDGSVKLFDLTAGKLIHHFAEHSGSITGLEFSQDGRLLATASNDGMVNVWNVDSFVRTAFIDTEGGDGSKSVVLQWQPDELFSQGVSSLCFVDSTTLVETHKHELAAWNCQGGECVFRMTELNIPAVADLYLSGDKLVGACMENNRLGVCVVDNWHSMLSGRPGSCAAAASAEPAKPAPVKRSSSVSSPRSSRTPTHSSMKVETHTSRRVNNMNKPTTPTSVASPKRALGRTATMSSLRTTPADKGVARSALSESSARRNVADKVDTPTRKAKSTKSLLPQDTTPRDKREGKAARTAAAAAPSTANAAAATSQHVPLFKAVHDRSTKEQDGQGYDSDGARRNPRVKELSGQPPDSGYSSDPSAHSRQRGANRPGSQSERTATVPAWQEATNHSAGVDVAPRAPSSSHMLAAQHHLGQAAPVEQRPSRLSLLGRQSDDNLENIPRNDGYQHTPKASAGRSSSLDKFLQEYGADQGRAYGVEEAECELMESDKSKHASVMNALRSRVTNYECVRTFWQQGNLAAMMKALKLDLTVACDAFDSLKVNREFFTMELSADAMPLICALLESIHDTHVAVGLDVLQLYCRNYGTVIRDTCAKEPDEMGVDLQLESRRERCMACRTSLQSVLPQLQQLTKQEREDDNLGRRAQDVQTELTSL